VTLTATDFGYMHFLVVIDQPDAGFQIYGSRSGLFTEDHGLLRRRQSGNGPGTEMADGKVLDGKG
jgi:hypothetical protein